ncbi:MAG TPA: methylated-DNA--[protein]-cysteine S-methyltransferase [Azospirillaceae bacterium]|nr:methylated-DNA--[protein]-cysteine S-methyltransferase [Azospirillaceae bacterium]
MQTAALTPEDQLAIDDPRTAALVARAIERLAADWQASPSLDDLAAEAGMSPWHFQRVFKRWAGISPKRFAQFVTLGHARRLLEERQGLLETALDVGLSGPSRLHDLFVSCEAMTPGEYKDQGRDLEIRFGFHDTPLGRALMAATPRGVCWLSFVGPQEAYGEDVNFEEFRREWPLARLVEDAAATERAAAAAFRLDEKAGPLTVNVKGTNFQIKVWQALLRIPHGSVATYEDVARSIGHPTSMRAVGNAVGANPISLIIPCHRVIRKTGVLDNYRWGPARKRALLAWEAARMAAE